MNKYWSRRLQSVVPYTAGEQPKGQRFIKINTNENPYPPSDRVLEAVKTAADDTLRLYPSINCDDLLYALAEEYGLKPNQIFAGNGSDEILAFCFPAFFNPDTPIVFADVTYSFYPVYAGLFGVDYRRIPLRGDFSLDVAEYCAPNGGVLIANPNAPTGIAVPLCDVEQILQANSDSVVILDEAYVDFGAESAVTLIDKYQNLLVVQTMSKSRSLAGLRVGYAMGNDELIKALRCVRDSVNSYTLDRVAQAAAIEAVRDRDYFQKTCRKIMETRDKTAGRLKALGFRVTDSKSNFVFMAHDTIPAVELYGKLREQGILVRHFGLPRIDNYLRVSVGTGCGDGCPGTCPGTNHVAVISSKRSMTCG